jgi:hypothetical protein
MSLLVKGVVTQTGADTFTSGTISTGMTADGKAGWEILGLKVFWSNGYLAAAADAIANAVLATINTVTLPNNDDEIARVSWAVQNTGGIAVAMVFEPSKKADLTQSRVTVQDELYIHVSTTTTGLTNVMYYELEYDIVKLTDIEVLRLLVGGA